MNGNYRGTEHYTLTKTENGWHGDPDDCEWQWFDFPDLTFTDDGDCRFELEAEAIDTAEAPNTLEARSNGTPTATNSRSPRCADHCRYDGPERCPARRSRAP